MVMPEVRARRSYGDGGDLGALIVRAYDTFEQALRIVEYHMDTYTEDRAETIASTSTAAKSYASNFGRANDPKFAHMCMYSHMHQVTTESTRAHGRTTRMIMHVCMSM